MFLVDEGAENIHAERHIGNHTLQSCNGRKCTSWDVLHPSFKFCAPANYPTNYDQQPRAQLPLNGRELNLTIQGTKMNVACHLYKCQMVEECPHFRTSQCENQTTRWKAKQKVLNKS